MNLSRYLVPSWCGAQTWTYIGRTISSSLSHRRSANIKIMALDIILLSLHLHNAA